MDIISAQYVLNEITNNNQSAIDAVIDGKLVHVPIDPANRHYQAILEFKQKTAYEIQAAE